MENSVESYINAQPEQAMSWDQYSAATTGFDSPDHWFSKIGDFFTGSVGKAKNQYEAYLKNLDLKNEYLATQSARAWEKYLDDTRIQRRMKDFEAAGLNPYLAVTESGLSGGSSGSGIKASYGSTYSKRNDDNGAKGRNFALIILALAKVAASLL